MEFKFPPIVLYCDFAQKQKEHFGWVGNGFQHFRGMLLLFRPSLSKVLTVPVCTKQKQDFLGNAIAGKITQENHGKYEGSPIT